MYSYFFFSSRRRHTRCELVTGVQTCALPIWSGMIRLTESAGSLGAADIRFAALDLRRCVEGLGLGQYGRRDCSRRPVSVERGLGIPRIDRILNRAQARRLGADKHRHVAGLMLVFPHFCEIGRAHVLTSVTNAQ